jgi:hypothetical protein
MIGNMEQFDDDEKLVPIRPYGTAELAAFYEKSPRAFNRWIKPFREAIGPRIGHIYTIRQVKIIFGFLERPYINRDP